MYCETLKLLVTVLKKEDNCHLLERAQLLNVHNGEVIEIVREFNYLGISFIVFFIFQVRDHLVMKK